MSKHQGVAEILNEISGIKDFSARQDKLSTYANLQPLIQILHATFHPDVQFMLPSGIPPYTPMKKSADLQGALFQQTRIFYIFIKGLSPDIPQLRRETMFVQLLESIDPDDAVLVANMKDKKMIYPGITYDLVAKTFPGLLPENGNPVREEFEPTKTVSHPLDLSTLDLKELEIVPNPDGNLPEKKTKTRGPMSRDGAVPCPHGCVSNTDDGLFLPHHLKLHMKKHKN